MICDMESPNSRSIQFFLLAVTCLTYTSSKKPHILLIVADDLGWNDVSFHGSTQIPTPNIDMLAHEGVILNNYYVQHICTPTRSALLSGKHPIHTGLQHDVIMGSEPYGLPLNHTTMAEFLKRKSYSTHIVGKWHLGFFAKEYTPTYRGFDSHFGYYTGKEDYYDHTSEEEKGYWGFDLHRNMEVDWPTFGEYATQMFTTEAVNLIKNHNQDMPMFLYLAHLAVHSGNSIQPLQAPQKYIDKFSYIEDENRRIFAAMASLLDESVGNVTAALKQVGMYNDTVIIFTTDNGGPAAGFNRNAASNWPLRGVKATLWEGGIRGSAFIHSPLLKEPGRVSMEMMHVCDWLPTLFHLAEGNPADLPPDLDGFNVWDSLSRGEKSPRTEILHNIDPIENSSAIRVGDYKLVSGECEGGKWDGWYKPQQFTHPTGSDLDRTAGSVLADWKGSRWSAVVDCGPIPANASQVCKPSKAPCLFNIHNDPCEFYNLADQYPDKVKELLARLDDYQKTAVPPGKKPGDPLADPKLHGGAWVPWITL